MKTYYEAEDGTRFSSKEECLEYERKKDNGLWAFAFAIIVIILFV